MKKSLFFNQFEIFAILFFILSVNSTLAQSMSSLRGMDVLNDSTAWFSGSKGTVLHSVDYGKHLTNCSPKGFEKKDFRDIVALNDSTLVVMSAGDSAVILFSNKKGKTWQLAYSDNRKGIFLDVIKINKTNGIGIAMGDPLHDTLFEPTLRTNLDRLYFVTLLTNDFGKTWTPIPNGTWNEANDTLNGLFAASGTSLAEVEFSAIPRPSILQKRNNYPQTSKHDFPLIQLIDLNFFYSGGGKTAAILRHCHLRLNLLSFPKSNSKSAKLGFHKTENYNLKFPTGDGWGIYSLSLFKEPKTIEVPVIKWTKIGFYRPASVKYQVEIAAAGGHWKYPDSSTKSLNHLVFTVDSLGGSYLIDASSYNANYCSGLAWNHDGTRLAITTNSGVKLYKNQQFQTKLSSKKILESYPQSNVLDTIEKGLNCVRFGPTTLWAVGNKGKIICKKLTN